MIRGLRWAASAAFLLLASAGTANAQYYPGGYGGYGWGGWGGATTAYGDQARGLGALAAGAGVYNVQTAQARAINTQTAMQWNEYAWACQDEHNRRNAARMANQRKLVNETADTTLNRLRNNPTQSDITKGDALNVALNEVMNPKVYTKALEGGKQKFPGTKIREIPFQYAAAALTLSVDDLIEKGPPPVFTDPVFAADRAGLREIRTKLRDMAEKDEQFDPKLLADAKAHIKRMQASLAADPEKFKKGSSSYREAENYLKGLYGFVTMLEGPSINVVLAGVENRPDTTVGDLLAFMQSFNLRFGVAKSPQQIQVYNELWGILDGLRDEVVGAGIAPSGTARAKNPGPEFFSGMQYEHLDAKRTPPAPPTPGNAKP